MASDQKSRVVLDRRQLLSAFGLSTLAACAPPGDVTPDPEVGPTPRTPEPTTSWPGVAAANADSFPNGVASGDPTSTGVRLWTRYVGTSSVSVHVAAWAGSAFSEASVHPAQPDEDGFCHVDLDGLDGDTWYAFQFVDDVGAASIAGLTHTALPDDHDGVVRLLATSCLYQEHVYPGTDPEWAGVNGFPSLTRAMARGPADLILWLGDFAYFDGLSTADEYRELWRRQQVAPGISDALRNVPALFTLDDHEITNNFDPETIDPELFEVARSALLQHTPIRPDSSGRIWRSRRYGAAVELFVLDCRTERQPSLGVYISRAQMDWIKAGLAASEATWKVVLNSVPISEYPPIQAGDRWLGFPEQRAELMDFITGEGLSGVLFVAGDVHMNALSRVGLDGPWASVLEILGGPGGSTLNFAGPLLRGAVNFVHADAQWACTRMEFSVDGTAVLHVINEDDEDIMVATIDVHGEVLSLTTSYE